MSSTSPRPTTSLPAEGEAALVQTWTRRLTAGGLLVLLMVLALLLLPVREGVQTLLVWNRDGSIFWYLSRAAGFLAYLTLWLSTLAGLLLGSRRLIPRVAPVVIAVHLWAGTWAVYTAIFHTLLLRYDNYVSFRWVDLLLPFAAHYQPLLMALGIYALYASLGVVITGFLRSRMPQPLWRLYHGLSAVAYLLALGHGVMLGTDSSTPWALWLYATTTGGMVVVFLVRLVAAPAPTPATRSLSNR